MALLRHRFTWNLPIDLGTALLSLSWLTALHKAAHTKDPA